MSGNNVILEEWLLRAEDDEKNALSILMHRDGTPAGVCFLVQQAVEKQLKSLLVRLAGDAPRVHDLIDLANKISKKGVVISEDVREGLIILNTYYISSRYPADIPLESFTWQMAEEAMAILEQVKREVDIAL